MNKILKELYYDNIDSYINPKVKDTEYDLINEKINSEKEEWLKSILSADDYVRFEKLECLYTGSSEIENLQFFINGFKLASCL